MKRTMNQYNFSAMQKQQQGAVLVVGLMLLLLMTVLALSGSSSAITSSHLIDSFNKDGAAFQSAQDILEKTAADPNCFTNAASEAIDADAGSPPIPSTCTISGQTVYLITSAATLTDEHGNSYTQVSIRVDVNLVMPDNTSVNITQGFQRNYNIQQ